MSTSPLVMEYDPDEVRDVSRAIALARTEHGTWVRVFSLMDALVGFEVAGRWLVCELEIAGVFPPADARVRGPSFRRHTNGLD